MKIILMQKKEKIVVTMLLGHIAETLKEIVGK
jgi:hypothetical protein